MKTKYFGKVKIIPFSIIFLFCIHPHTILSNSIQDLELASKYEEQDLGSNNSTELRYLTFGTSVTWGSMIPDRNKAYPFLLSSTVTNLAMRASDSSYPSMCTQSMIQDSIYDVIIIEYDRRRFNFLLNLVRRLRERFPDATIILTKMWSLMDVLVTEKGEEQPKKLREWVIKSGKPGVKEGLEFVLNSDVTFSWDKMIRARESTMESAEKEYNAIIYSWETDTDIRELLRYRIPMFEDNVHFNEYGHSVVAKDLADIVSEANAKRSDRVGTWGDGDACFSWFHDGLFLDDYRTVLRFNSIPMNKFDERNEKYALELKRESHILQVYNPFDGPRNLYLTYMASYPNKMYPKIAVRCNSKDLTIIDPIAKYDFPVHVQDTKLVGLVKPGRNLIKVQQITEEEEEEDQSESSISSVAPFRLVGIVITNENFNPTDMYFKPLES